MREPTSTSSEVPPPHDDPRVIAVLEEYASALRAGRTPCREELQARHPEIAGALAECLAGLDFLQAAGPQLHAAAEDLGGPGAAEVPTGVPLGDFRIVREIGRGGMGVVYEAEQLSLGRRVALKVLPLAAAFDARQLLRFKNEALAAAGLHHPNIVPVISVGCERGVHYFAMQLIEGRTLAELIADLRRADAPAAGTPSTETPPVAALSTEPAANTPAFFRSVADLGAQAAAALEHAHSLGVVHRDVKPANLLLDASGKVWVTDFGLAHLADRPAVTLTGDVVGTLRYMSPEQALGGRGVVDQRTDVYSLGATLYELATLRTVFEGRDRHEVLRQIAFEEPTPPRRLNPEVPHDLETVLLKALSKEREQRYATAAELADDLRRFLEDRPVLARRPGVLGRAQKWSRRHRPVVVSAAVCMVLLALTLLAGLSLNNVLLRREQRRTAAEKVRTRENLRLALEALDRLYLRVAEQSAPRDPAREREYRQLLDDALRFYEAFARQNQDDPEARQATATAYQRAGEIYQRLGRLPAAEEAYRQAASLREQLAAEEPQTQEYRRGLADALNHLGVVLQAAGRPAEADPAHQRAEGLMERLVAEEPGEPLYRANLAAALNNRGIVLARTGRLEEAHRVWRQAQDHRQRLVADFPDEPSYRHEAASTAQNLGNVLRTLGRPGEAEPLYLQARASLEKLARVRPSPSYRADLARAHYNLGFLWATTGRAAEAEWVYRDGLRVLEVLVAEFPAAQEDRQLLATTLTQLVAVLAALGRHEEAEALHARLAKVFRQLAADFPANWETRQLEATALNNWGKALSDRGRAHQAEGPFRQVVELRRQLAEEMPNAPEVRQGLIRAYQNLAAVLREIGRPREAEAAYRQALACVEALAAAFPRWPEAGPAQVDCQLALGQLLHRSGRLAAAEEELRQGLSRAEQLAAGKADPNQTHRQAFALGHLGNVLRLAGRHTEAEEALGRARRLLEPLAAGSPKAPSVRELLATVHEYRGLLCLAAGREEEADKAYREALGVYRALAKDFPTRAGPWRSLAWLLANGPRTRLRDPDEAVAGARRAAELAPESAPCWTALGVALYRASRWRDAAEALGRAERLRGDAVNRLFLAMAHARLGAVEEARRWSDRAREAAVQEPWSQDDLRQGRAEADALLAGRKKETR